MDNHDINILTETATPIFGEVSFIYTTTTTTPFGV